MNKEQKIGCLFGILRILLSTPLYYTLLYLILKHINATDVIWLIFWIYAPVSIVLALGLEIASTLAKGKPTEVKQ